MKTEDRERELLGAIVKGQQARGYAPTRRELAREIGISTTRVQQLVASCMAKGYLSTPPRMARAYVVHQVPASVVFYGRTRGEGPR